MIAIIYQRNICDGTLEFDEVISNVKSIKDIGGERLSVMSIDFVNVDNRIMNRCIRMDGSIEVRIE